MNELNQCVKTFKPTFNKNNSSKWIWYHVTKMLFLVYKVGVFFVWGPSPPSLKFVVWSVTKLVFTLLTVLMPLNNKCWKSYRPTSSFVQNIDSRTNCFVCFNILKLKPLTAGEIVIFLINGRDFNHTLLKK